MKGLHEGPEFHVVDPQGKEVRVPYLPNVTSMALLTLLLLASCNVVMATTGSDEFQGGICNERIVHTPVPPPSPSPEGIADGPDGVDPLGRHATGDDPEPYGEYGNSQSRTILFGKVPIYPYAEPFGPIGECSWQDKLSCDVKCAAAAQPGQQLAASECHRDIIPGLRGMLVGYYCICYWVPSTPTKW
jgi:hypothetical protein